MNVALVSCNDLPGWEVDDTPLIEALPLDDCIGTISMVNEVPEIACVYGFGSSVPDEQLAKVHNKIANPNLLFIPT